MSVIKIILTIDTEGSAVGVELPAGAVGLNRKRLDSAYAAMVRALKAHNNKIASQTIVSETQEVLALENAPAEKEPSLPDPIEGVKDDLSWLDKPVENSSVLLIDKQRI